MCPCHRGSKRRPYLPLLSALPACPGMFTLWLFIALHGVCMLQPCLTLAVHPARASSRVSFMPSAWAPSIICHEQEVRGWMGLPHGAFCKPVLPATESVEAISGHAATVSRSQEHHMHLHVQHASHHWSTLSCTRALLQRAAHPLRLLHWEVLLLFSLLLFLVSFAVGELRTPADDLAALVDRAVLACKRAGSSFLGHAHKIKGQ